MKYARFKKDRSASKSMHCSPYTRAVLDNVNTLGMYVYTNCATTFTVVQLYLYYYDNNKNLFPNKNRKMVKKDYLMSPLPRYDIKANNKAHIRLNN